MSKGPIPGEGNTPAGIFYLGNAYFEAANIVHREHKHAFTDHPVRMLFLHAIECYLRASLRALEIRPGQIRAYSHDLAEMARDCCEGGMELPEAALHYLEGATKVSDYVNVRYDFYLRDKTGARPKKLPALIETTISVERSARDLLAKLGWPSLDGIIITSESLPQ